VIGARRTAAVIERAHGLDAVGDVRELMALLRT